MVPNGVSHRPEPVDHATMVFEAQVVEGRTFDRRLAPRRSVDGLTVEVVYEAVRSFGRRKTHRLAMQVLDLSIEGALLAGPLRRELRSGGVIGLETGGAAMAEIRHVSPRGDSALYGVRFVQMEQRFRDLVFRQVGRDREALHDAWLNAR